MKPAVTFDRVWKRFKKGERHDSIRDLLPSLLRRAVRRVEPVEDERDFWAVKDVSFEVKPGEALGVIGPNGAGKSTTLKLLTRILKPTRGFCSVEGRVGALIEVAAGFHPDLTGRENVFLQGAIMGMKRAEIARKLDAIVEFSGIEAFLDTPVKRYSSGMNARLGFSIAAHLDPDVLIIDEVLAVGDMAFQEKCRIRMTEFRRNGVAIVFVSHNLQAVAQLCTHGLFLDKGVVQLAGTPTETISRYCHAPTKSDEAALTVSRFTVDGVSQPAALKGELLSVKPGARIAVTAELVCPVPLARAILGVAVWDETRGVYCYVATTDRTGAPPFEVTAGQRIRVRFEVDAHLTRGVYQLQTNIFDLSRQDSVCGPFTIQMFSIDESSTYHGTGSSNLSLRTDAVEIVDALEVIGAK
jgi:lipopolysaccharide transport system ATP-binding protein